MFIWDFTALFAVFVIVFLGIVLSMWMFYTLNVAKSPKIFNEGANFWNCKYCGHVFVEYVKRDILRCPRCLSYLD